MGSLEDIPSSLVSQSNMKKPSGIQAATLSLQSLPSFFQPLCHPRVDEVTEEVDGYFLKHWDFPNEKARKKFVAAGFPASPVFTSPRPWTTAYTLPVVC